MYDGRFIIKCVPIILWSMLYPQNMPKTRAQHPHAYLVGLGGTKKGLKVINRGLHYLRGVSQVSQAPSNLNRKAAIQLIFKDYMGNR